MNQKVQDAINAQIADEFYASYLYLSMMAYFEAESLGGFAQWMRMQAQEEQPLVDAQRAVDGTRVIPGVTMDVGDGRSHELE